VYLTPTGQFHGYEDGLEGFFLFDAVKAVGKAVVGVGKKVVSAVPKAAVGFVTGGPGGAIAAGGASILASFGGGGGGARTPPAGTSAASVIEAMMRIRAQQAARQQVVAQRSVQAALPAPVALGGGALVPLAIAAGVILLTMRRR
jgi:hypothetical protein